MLTYKYYNDLKLLACFKFHRGLLLSIGIGTTCVDEFETARLGLKEQKSSY